MREWGSEMMRDTDWMMLLFIVKDLSDKMDEDPEFKVLWSKLVKYCYNNKLIFQEEMAGSF